MTRPGSFRYFKMPPQSSHLAVMAYVRCLLSLRDVEDLLHERGIDTTHEAVRFCQNRLATIFATEIRGLRVQAMRDFQHRRWHHDEVFVTTNGVRRCPGWAVDHEGKCSTALSPRGATRRRR